MASSVKCLNNPMKRQANNAEDLGRAIAQLELLEAAQKREIERTFMEVSENLKPMNLVKSGVRSVFSAEHKEDLINGLIGLGTGFLSRRLLLGRTNGVVGKTVGKAIQWGMAGLVSKNAEKIKEKAGEIIDRLFKRKPVSPHSPAFQNKDSEFRQKA
jgi:hypothetical protein